MDYGPGFLSDPVRTAVEGLRSKFRELSRSERSPRWIPVGSRALADGKRSDTTSV